MTEGGFSDDDFVHDLIDAMREKGWEADRDFDVLVCPHGHSIEPDGTCPEGCVSPLVSMGLI